MFVLCVLTLAILVALYNKSFSNFYFKIILEIIAWYFIRDAVNGLFLQRPKIRTKNIQTQKLCSAKIEVIKVIK